MAYYNNSSNTPKQHQEAAVFSNYEMVLGRKHTLINTREHVHAALPLVKPTTELVQSAAEHASRMVEQTAQFEQIQDDAPTAQIIQFPVRAEDDLQAARRRTREAYGQEEAA